MELSYVSHESLLPFLEADLPARVFAAYVCGRVPEGESLAVTDAGRVLAVFIDGARFACFEACGPWIFARDDASAQCVLAEAAKTGVPHGLSFPAMLAPLVQHRFPAAILSQDRLFAADAETLNRASSTPGQLVAMVPGDPHWSNLPPSLVRVGSEEFSSASPLWGWLQDGRVTAVVDTRVRYGHYACLGEVTAEGGGPDVVETLVTHVSDALLSQGLIPLLVALGHDVPAHELAAKAGFREVARLGCIEFGDEPEVLSDIE